MGGFLEESDLRVRNDLGRADVGALYRERVLELFTTDMGVPYVVADFLFARLLDAASTGGSPIVPRRVVVRHVEEQLGAKAADVNTAVKDIARRVADLPTLHLQVEGARRETRLVGPTPGSRGRAEKDLGFRIRYEPPLPSSVPPPEERPLLTTALLRLVVLGACCANPYLVDNRRGARLLRFAARSYRIAWGLADELERMAKDVSGIRDLPHADARALSVRIERRFSFIREAVPVGLSPSERRAFELGLSITLANSALKTMPHDHVSSKLVQRAQAIVDSFDYPAAISVSKFGDALRSVPRGRAVRQDMKFVLLELVADAEESVE